MAALKSPPDAVDGRPMAINRRADAAKVGRTRVDGERIGTDPVRGRRISALVARGPRGRTPATPPGGRFQANRPMGSAQPGVSQLELVRSPELPLGSSGQTRRMVGSPGPERVVMPLVL